MSSDASLATLNVSLEDHLADSLRPLLGLLPISIASELKDILNTTHATPSTTCHSSEASEHAIVPTVPYALLTAISKWARTPAAEQAMSSHEPPLRVQDYSMVALLAGTRTSPERKFPFVFTPSTAFQASHKRELGDRRAVTAVINALLSIAGSALATWWAAGRLSWRDEWKVLFALSVAVVVATSEAFLYLIWESRRNKSPRLRPVRLDGAAHTDSGVLALGDKKRDADSPEELARANDENVAVTTAISARILSTSSNSPYERTPASVNNHDVPKHDH